MQKFDSESLRNTTDLTSKALSLSFKLGILAGSACLLFYCEKIHYLPAGFTTGDGILFFFLATIFGYVYIIILATLIGLGVFGMLVLQKFFVYPVFKIVFKIKKNWYVKYTQKYYW